MALALQDMGIAARSWLGWQLPIRTDDPTAVRIVGIETAAVDARLREGHVAVVPGFQGISGTTVSRLSDVAGPIRARLRLPPLSMRIGAISIPMLTAFIPVIRASL